MNTNCLKSDKFSLKRRGLEIVRKIEIIVSGKIKALLVTYAAIERALPHVETRLLLASLANSVTLTNSGTTRKIPSRSSPNPLAVFPLRLSTRNSPEMKLNEKVVIYGTRVILVPYERDHVQKYHDWMKDQEILEATASEPLTIDKGKPISESISNVNFYSKTV